MATYNYAKYNKCKYVRFINNVNVGADKGKPDWRCFKDFMAREGPIKKELVIRLLRDAISVLSK
jgi:hypothetical protein